jgi:hypothetical protein
MCLIGFKAFHLFDVENRVWLTGERDLGFEKLEGREEED